MICGEIASDILSSSPPSATYVRQWNGSSLVQVMACCLFGGKPLPEPMLVYCQLNSSKQVSVIFEFEFYHFHTRKYIWKCRLPKWWPFCPGGDGSIRSDHWIIIIYHHIIMKYTLKIIDSQISFSQIPQCIGQVSHNAPICNRNVHICAHFCYKMMHYGIGALWHFYNRFILF